MGLKLGYSDGQAGPCMALVYGVVHGVVVDFFLNKSVLTSSTSVLSYIKEGIISEQKWTYKPYTLVGPPVIRPVPDPLAVLSHDN